jgi:hypothetical protein
VDTVKLLWGVISYQNARLAQAYKPDEMAAAGDLLRNDLYHKLNMSFDFDPDGRGRLDIYG